MLTHSLLFWFVSIVSKENMRKARHERRKFRKRYIFHNSCAWQKKKSSVSARSKENHLPFLCEASPSNPGLCRSEEWASLILQWAGEAVQRDGHQPDYVAESCWNPSGYMPLAVCPTHPFLVLVFFSPQKGLLHTRGFLKGKRLRKALPVPRGYLGKKWNP